MGLRHSASPPNGFVEGFEFDMAPPYFGNGRPFTLSFPLQDGIWLLWLRLTSALCD
jgi:hypothetical protein